MANKFTSSYHGRSQGVLGAIVPLPQESKIDRAFDATRLLCGPLVHPKCKFFRGSAMDPAGGAYTAPPDLLAGEEGA